MDALLEEIISVLGEYAGPIAKFVVKKQVTGMGESMEDFPRTRVVELIDLCIDACIYNPNLKGKVRKALIEISTKR